MTTDAIVSHWFEKGREAAHTSQYGDMKAQTNLLPQKCRLAFLRGFRSEMKELSDKWDNAIEGANGKKTDAHRA